MAKTSDLPTWSPQAVEELIRCEFLSMILGDCIVADGYSPPVTLTTQIKLTRRGSQLANQIKGNGVTLAEAQTATFIQIWSGDDLLVEPSDLNLEELRANISSEIERRRIKFPWVFGRLMYDRIAESTYTYRSPTADETQALLHDMPVGVAQYGPYVAGPYGLVEAAQWRHIRVSRSVPGYHCEKVECSRIHLVHLKTGESGASKARENLGKKVSRVHSPMPGFADIVLNQLAREIPEYNWLDSARLPHFIFECFTLEDIRLLLASLLDRTSGVLRSKLRDLDQEVGDATRFASGLSEDQILHLLLLCSDDSIHHVLNDLIWADSISIPRGEVRSVRIARATSGNFGTSIEGSGRGVRFRPRQGSIQLRLRQLVSECFAPVHELSGGSKLSWLLRQHVGASTSEKLSSALSTDDPTALVERLIVADREAYDTASKALRVDHLQTVTSSDSDLADIISWHIGFEVADENRDIADVVRRLQDLRGMVRSLPQDNLDRIELSRVRELASNVFVDLERILKEVLHFSVWALLGDHFGQSLVHSPSRALEAFSKWISEQGLDEKINNIGKMDLGEILTCFGALSKQLRNLQSSKDSYRRSSEEWPRRAGLSGNPRRFPYQHTRLFLDFDTNSREALTELVESVTSRLQQTKVLEVRNSVFHHWETSPTRDVIASALDSIDARLSELTGAGLYPLVYGLHRITNDNSGRRQIILAANHGPEVVLVRPASVSLSGFPDVSERQTVLLRGRLDQGHEPMRFRMQEDSDYRRMWSDFPRRRPRALSREEAASFDDDSPDG